MIYRGTGFIVVSNVEFFIVGLHAIFQVLVRQVQMEFFLISLHAIFQVPILRQEQKVLNDL